MMCCNFGPLRNENAWPTNQQTDWQDPRPLTNQMWHYSQTQAHIQPLQIQLSMSFHPASHMSWILLPYGFTILLPHCRSFQTKPQCQCVCLKITTSGPSQIRKTTDIYFKEAKYLKSMFQNGFRVFAIIKYKQKSNPPQFVPGRTNIFWYLWTLRGTLNWLVSPETWHSNAPEIFANLLVSRIQIELNPDLFLYLEMWWTLNNEIWSGSSGLAGGKLEGATTCSWIALDTLYRNTSFASGADLITSYSSK